MRTALSSTWKRSSMPKTHPRSANSYRLQWCFLFFITTSKMYQFLWKRNIPAKQDLWLHDKREALDSVTRTEAHLQLCPVITSPQCRDSPVRQIHHQIQRGNIAPSRCTTPRKHGTASGRRKHRYIHTYLVFMPSSIFEFRRGIHDSPSVIYHPTEKVRIRSVFSGRQRINPLYFIIFFTLICTCQSQYLVFKPTPWGKEKK